MIWLYIQCVFCGWASSPRSRQWSDQALAPYLLQPVTVRVLCLKSRSARGYLSCDRRQEWTTHCFMLEGTYVCDSTLLWVGHARQIPYWRYSSITMLLYESNRAVQQNKTLILWQCTSWKYLEFWSILCAYCIQDSHLFNDDKQSHILLLHCC